MHPLEILQIVKSGKALSYCPKDLATHMDEGDLDPNTCMWLDLTLCSNYVKRGWSPVQGIILTWGLFL